MTKLSGGAKVLFTQGCPAWRRSFRLWPSLDRGHVCRRLIGRRVRQHRFWRGFIYHDRRRFDDRHVRRLRYRDILINWIDRYDTRKTAASRLGLELIIDLVLGLILRLAGPSQLLAVTRIICRHGRMRALIAIGRLPISITCMHSRIFMSHLR